MIQLKNISKTYNQNKENEVKALKGLNLVLSDSGMVFLVGESGSGKTTLLNILSSIERPSSGEMYVDGKNISQAKENKLKEYRNKDIGIIFQNYNLLQDETVLSNIKLALELQGRKKLLQSNANIEKVLEKVGLAGYGKRKITQLSGGQQQRVAIARALIKSPKIIFADEPTGNLDSETSESIMELFKELSKNRLVVIVCHDLELANKYADRIITLKDGSIEKDEVLSQEQKHIEKEAKEKKKTKHLSYARQLKFAIKNLWAIKFRLIVVIVMLGISIATAGVGALTSRYDREDTRARAYHNSGLNSLIVREQDIHELDAYNNPIIQTGFMKQKLMDESKIAGLEEISDGEYYKIYGTSDIQHETLLVTGDFTRLEEFGFKVIKGRYPQKAGEVAVSISWAVSRGAEISSDNGLLENLIGKNGIVGIVDCDETKLNNFAQKVYYESIQRDMLIQKYLEKESERGRTKFMFVMEEDMDKYRDNFKVFPRINVYYLYDDGSASGSIGNQLLSYDMANYMMSWYRKTELEDIQQITMSEVDELIENGLLKNYSYIGKNPDELEEDEIVFTMFNYYSGDYIYRNDSHIISVIIDKIQQQKGIDYNVSQAELLDYIANNEVECEIQFDTSDSSDIYSDNYVTVTKKMKIVGAVCGDYTGYNSGVKPLYDFIYSDKLDMLEVAFNNYGVVGYVANIGSNLDKDRELLDYCEANNLDYNGIMTPYLEDADYRAQYLQKISVTLTIIFAFISLIILTNLTLICVHKNKKQMGLLRSLGSGVADNVGIYLSQGAICGIIVAILTMVFFPLAVNICASGSGLSVLEPIFKGINDLYGNYSPYLDDMINILPVYATDYLIISIVAISLTMLITVLPLLFRLRQKPMDLLREEGDL